MQFDDPIDNSTEATMTDTATPRYGYAPQAMFAATRAGAERRARENAVAATSAGGLAATPRLLRRLVTHLASSTDSRR